MSEDNQAAQPAQQKKGLDPAFFECVNEVLEVANTQAKRYGVRRISISTLHAAAFFNTRAFLAEMQPNVAAHRAGFLDNMTALYRSLLNDHLDTMGANAGIDVGESELAEQYKASGYVPGKGFTGTPEA